MCYLKHVKLRQQSRFYPTDDQKNTLARTFGCARFVYNWGLRLRKDSYQQGITLSYVDTSSELTKIKRLDDFAFLQEVSCVPTQQALRHLQTAFTNFFQKRTRYPSFKKKRGKQSAEYTRSAFKWDAGNKNLSIAQLGRLKIKWSREFKSNPSTVTITKDTAERYFVTLVLDEQIAPMDKTGKNVGIDLGINRLATFSNGERIPNPRHFRKMEKKLAREQRILSRRKKGSKRRNRQRRKVARVHAKIADARLDYLHKLTTDTVRRFDKISIEDLNVQGMKRSNLAKSISDASFGLFRQLLTYKCEWYGKGLLLVDRFFPSSKRCFNCGYVFSELNRSTQNWTCEKCGSEHDRDENAAKNILAAGHAVSAQGGTVRRGRGAPRLCKFRRAVNQPIGHIGL